MNGNQLYSADVRFSHGGANYYAVTLRSVRLWLANEIRQRGQKPLGFLLTRRTFNQIHEAPAVVMQRGDVTGIV